MAEVLIELWPQDIYKYEFLSYNYYRYKTAE